MYSWEWSMLNLCRDQLPALRTSIVSELSVRSLESRVCKGKNQHNAYGLGVQCGWAYGLGASLWL
ncbi:hypothetical protein GBA52_001351 [Prunus armeniaca]|nr:hypothetical protein GBA52_001351 [Prunus armeniaca]